jgi:dihydrolipoyl dehydrogenase
MEPLLLPDTARTYDLVIIGAGPGGYVAAVRAAQLGLKTAVVEKDRALGGTCLLRGCVPTKFLLQAASLHDELKHGSRYGIMVDAFHLNWAKTLEEKTKTVRRLSGAVSALMKKGKIDVVSGTGRLAGPRKVIVSGESGETTLETRFVLLATGSVPKMLPFLRRDGTRVITSDEALELPAIPASLIVVGSGAVGSEFASVYHSFGTRVTLIEALPRLIPLEDSDMSRELEKAFTKRGIAIRTGARVEGAEVSDAGVKVQVTTSGKTESLEAEILLVAVGRGPYTENLGLETTALRPDPRGFVLVDPFMRTAESGIYAIGDLVPTQGLAHLAAKEGILAVEHMAGHPVIPIRYETVPNAIYCEPEVASVGLTEDAAREKGIEVKIGKFPFTHSTKAMIAGHQEGLVKIVSDARYDEVLGVHIIGPKATELIAEAVVGMTLETTTTEMFRAIHPHPTLSEAVMEAAENLHGESIHI